ncbi:MAG: hypothetical protein R6T98_11990 [Desulfatiglandales bacterium]
MCSDRRSPAPLPARRSPGRWVGSTPWRRQNSPIDKLLKRPTREPWN